MISGKVIGKSIDENGNIKVESEYTLTDGSKTTGVTRYHYSMFTPEKVLEDIQAQCRNHMLKVYNLKQCQELIDEDLSQVKVDLESFEYITVHEVKDKDGVVIVPKESIIIDDL